MVKDFNNFTKKYNLQTFNGISQSFYGMNKRNYCFLMIFLMMGFLEIASAQAQVKEYSFKPAAPAGVKGASTFSAPGAGAEAPVSEEVILAKGIPRNPHVKVSGDGKPKALYVVQLARFEFMKGVPEEFPKGSFLWINPDLRSEKLLLSGFYDTYEDANEAALEWKKQKQFSRAFARPKPFMIVYE